MIITKTPFRLSFFGGGTDYNPWFEKNGGLVIGSAFTKYCYISIRRLPPFFDHKTRVVYSKSEQVSNISDIEHPAVRSCLQYLDIHEGLEVHHDGDLPARSGIGSSSSFTVGFLKGLHALQSQMISKMDLAKEAIYVEQHVANENVGIQDQIFASFGGLQIIDMEKGGNINVRPLILPKDYRENLESHIMLAFSGLTRFSSDTAQKQIDSIKQGSIENQMFEMHDIAREGLSLFEQNADIDKLGKLFEKSWFVKRSVSDAITNEYIDNIYDKAKKAGAFGGRLLGAGGGGFLMFVAPPEKHQEIRDALKDEVKVWVPFNFDYKGSQVILYDEHHL